MQINWFLTSITVLIKSNPKSWILNVHIFNIFSYFFFNYSELRIQILYWSSKKLTNKTFFPQFWVVTKKSKQICRFRIQASGFDLMSTLHDYKQICFETPKIHNCPLYLIHFTGQSCCNFASFFKPSRLHHHRGVNSMSFS